MHTPRRVRCLCLLTMLAVMSLPGGSASWIHAQVFSVDPASPLASVPGGSPANLYRPGPGIYAPAASIGLLAGDDIDAFSFGFDVVSTTFPMGFSPDFFTSGAIAPGNAVCSESGFCPPAVPCPPEAMADLFSSLGGGVASVKYDGDGAPGVGVPLGLTECPAGGPGVQDNVDAFDELMAPLSGTTPAWRVYFSLAPGSPTLGGANPLLPGGARPADILTYDPAHKSLSIFFSAAGMGLNPAGDDIDGISLNVATSDFFFSLAPGSVSLGSPAICGPGCTAGDFIRSRGPVCGATPCNFFGPGGYAIVGLAPGDNVDAVDQDSRVPAYINNPPDDTSPGKTFSVDSLSPVLAAIRTSAAPIRSGSAADLLGTNRANPTGAPRIIFRAESLGLQAADDIDGLSFGRETMFNAAAYDVEFSVARNATGAAGSAVSVEASAATGREASADVFGTFLPTFAGSNTQVWDGNGTSAPLLHLRDVPLDLASNDSVDALEGPSQIIDANNDGVRDARVYFSLAPGSPTLGLIGATPADILVCPPPSCALPGIFLSGAALGLPAGANLEDFVLEDSISLADFTLPPADAVALGGDPGGIFRRGGVAPCGAAACPIVPAPSFGLIPGFAGDNMLGFDSVDPLLVCVRILAGGDPTLVVFHGVCPPPGVSGPFDVIEGELGELSEAAPAVNVSRVYCRAQSLGADNLSLGGGLDRFTRAQFILARNTGIQLDYGKSTLGNFRFPSFGDCP